VRRDVRRRSFLALVAVAACSPWGDAVTTAAELARAVMAGTRAALRASVLRVLEPTKGPWVNQNTFGDQFFGPLPASAGQVFAVLPKNTGLYGPPAVHSIQLGRSDAVDAQNADVYARITVGCGGVENSFDMDWLHGAQIAVVCNSLNVQAVTYAPSAAGNYAASGAAVALKAMVAKGSTNPSRCPATYTQAGLPLAEVATPGSSVIYNVPDFARELCVHVVSNPGNNNPATASIVTISFLNEGGSVLAQYNAQVCAGGRSIPIPGGANTVFIENTASQVPTVTAQWFLGL
jgi:hypothetical protein